MLTGNKGEWSEVYALFKLLSEGKLYSGDGRLNKIEQLYFPILKIIRNEAGKNFEYEVNGNLILITSDESYTVPITRFKEHAQQLLHFIKSGKGSFENLEVETFMQSYRSKTLKAQSTSKTDIRILIHDIRINQLADLGFSVKSELGNDATLLNAGETTNFVYKVNGYEFTAQEVDDINSISTTSKIRDRISAIKAKGATMSFQKVHKEVFNNNLVMIDSLLPGIVSEMLLLFFTTKLSSVFDLTEATHKKNPLQYDSQHSHMFYEYKIKRLLTDVFVGMMPSKVWTGTYDATGGHLIVKQNGDVLCYHIYNRNQFEDYLYYNTRLESASSTRHKYGVLYYTEADNSFYFKLNLQIRFK